MTPKRAKHSRKKKTNYLRVLFIIICIFTIFVSGFHILKWMKENKKSKENKNKIQESVTVEGDDLLVNFEKLKEENSDTVAWLKVEGTDIEYPVVKAQDNDYYLAHSFDGSYNSAGWIFADYKNTFDGTDKNIVIYGHNRRDGSMFGTLKKILDKDWYNNENNKYVTLVTEKGNFKYEVFSVYEIEKEDYYIKNRFNSGDEFEEFVKTVKERSIHDFETEVGRPDKILTLSTCADNNKYRVVLHAKKVSE